MVIPYLWYNHGLYHNFGLVGVNCPPQAENFGTSTWFWWIFCCVLAIWDRNFLRRNRIWALSFSFIFACGASWARNFNLHWEPDSNLGTTAVPDFLKRLYHIYGITPKRLYHICGITWEVVIPHVWYNHSGYAYLFPLKITLVGTLLWTNNPSVVHELIVWVSKLWPQELQFMYCNFFNSLTIVLS